MSSPTPFPHVRGMQLARLYFDGSNGYRAWKVREEEEEGRWRVGGDNTRIFNKIKVAIDLVEQLQAARGDSCTIMDAAREWDAALGREHQRAMGFKKPMGVASFCRYDCQPKLLRLVGLAGDGEGGEQQQVQQQEQQQGQQQEPGQPQRRRRSGRQ